MKDKIISSKVRDLRKSLGMSEMELAALSGLTTIQITNIERGYCKKPHCKTIKCLSEALRCDFEELYNYFYN